jgi:hypothetical protein
MTLSFNCIFKAFHTPYVSWRTIQNNMH